MISCSSRKRTYLPGKRERAYMSQVVGCILVSKVSNNNIREDGTLIRFLLLA